MNEFELNKILGNPDGVDGKIGYYLDKKILMKQEIQKNEISGHIVKAEHNLDFINGIKDRFNDWVLVACYYTSYHIVYASTLLAPANLHFSSKSLKLA